MLARVRYIKTRMDNFPLSRRFRACQLKMLAAHLFLTIFYDQYGLQPTFLIFYFIISGGRYFRLDKIEKFLQVLIWLFLPDTCLRSEFGLPTPANVDYRAACFCHRQLVDVGFVCSVCLSIFCKFTPICSTCHTVFANMMVKKKKSK